MEELSALRASVMHFIMNNGRCGKGRSGPKNSEGFGHMEDGWRKTYRKNMADDIRGRGEPKRR